VRLWGLSPQSQPREQTVSVDEELFDRDDAFPRLSEELIAPLDAAGRRRPLTTGEILFRAGDRALEFFVVLRGRVAIIDGYGSKTERVLGVHEEQRFVGELSLMTGQPSYTTAVVREDGEAIELNPDELQRVVGANQQLGDVILSAFIARRALLIGLGSGLRLIGSHLSPDSRRLREFLTRNRIPHTFVDLETDADAEQLLRGLSIAPGETPLVLRGSLALRNPTNDEVAGALNLRPAGAPDRLFDAVVVGAGPAGLGAAVYAASEGLSTALVDSVAIGGQASTSARIENYLGFPAGISGSQLAERAAIQATRFGAESAVPVTARSLSLEDGYHVVELGGDQRLRARAVVLATGASYRRIAVPRLADFEGAGVYYAATEVEAQICQDYPVVVIGGANSAGQAAVFLARRVGRVSLLLRGGDLTAGMSRYLVDQVQADPSIDVQLHAEVRELHGNGALEAVTVERNTDGVTRMLDARALFVFIGADPCTGWLDDALAIDEDGFILTGQDLRLTHLDPAADGRERAPLPLETSRPGVFAAGDVRSGSIKRVASAVGEGAMAVRMIHQYLATQRG
jgi:thioredoxin reductase (NADPH)